MKISLIAVLLLLAFAVPAAPQSGSIPTMSAVDPDTGTVGDILTVQGAGLGADAVAGVFLTDGKTDIKLVIVEQKATSIQFKIPPEAKAGRFALMVLTRGDKAKYVEEPVKVTVEAPPARPQT